MASGLADGPAGDLALGDEGADVVFGAVCVERDLGTVKDAQQFAFSTVKAGQKPVEQDVAGSPPEDAVEARAQRRRAPGTGRLLIELQVAVEPPDQMADEFDGTTLVRRRRHQLVDKPLGMDPTKRMVANAELACVIGYDRDDGSRPTSHLRWRS